MARKERIKTAMFKKPYYFSLIVFFLSYMLLNAWINDWHIFLAGIFNLYWYIFVPYTIFGLIIAFLVALALNLTYLRIRELQKVSGASGLTFIGVFFGVMTGACPGCLVGLLPAIIGIFGGTFVVSSLPLKGVEIQLLTIALMIFAIMTLSKDNTCKIKD